MTMTDPIADMLTRIRNANMVKHETLEVPASKIKRDIAEILKREGFDRGRRRKHLAWTNRRANGDGKSTS